jgi:hypothetical protein
MNVIESLTKSDNPVIALLAFMVLILSGVIVYQWRYTMNNTVPKFIWEDVVKKLDTLLDIQKDFQTKVSALFDIKINGK